MCRQHRRQLSACIACTPWATCTLHVAAAKSCAACVAAASIDIRRARKRFARSHRAAAVKTMASRPQPAPPIFACTAGHQCARHTMLCLVCPNCNPTRVCLRHKTASDACAQCASAVFTLVAACSTQTDSRTDSKTSE